MLGGFLLEKTFSEEKILDFEDKGIFKEKEFFPKLKKGLLGRKG